METKIWKPQPNCESSQDLTVGGFRIDYSKLSFLDPCENLMQYKVFRYVITESTKPFNLSSSMTSKFSPGTFRHPKRRRVRKAFLFRPRFGIVGCFGIVGFS
jgi:hypothetical protein